MLVTTLGDAIASIKRVHEHHRDDIVPTIMVEPVDLEHMKIRGKEYDVLPEAQYQICQRIGVPRSYMQKCIPSLQRTNMQHWMNNYVLDRKSQDHLLIRFYDDKIRAIFTERYKPLDNIDLANNLLAQSIDMDMKVQFNHGHRFMSLNLLYSKEAYNVPVGGFSGDDYMYPGISLINSEVGVSSFAARMFFFRLWCSNGAIVSHKFGARKFRHISDSNIDDVPRMLEWGRDSVGELRTITMNTLKRAREIKVDHVPETFEYMSKKYEVNEMQRAALPEAWEHEKGNSLFHIINTYTRAANSRYLDSEDRYSLQDIGGRMLMDVPKMEELPIAA